VVRLWILLAIAAELTLPGPALAQRAKPTARRARSASPATARKAPSTKPRPRQKALAQKVRASAAERRASGLLGALPSSARVRTLTGTAFTPKEGALEAYSATYRIAAGKPVAPQQLRWLRQQAEETIGRLPRVDTVLYPMSGFDAGTAAHLFPDAVTIIGIDNHPFLPPGDSRTSFEYSRVGSANYAAYQDIDRLGHVGPALVGSLAEAVPGFRLRRVSIIENDEPTTGVRSSPGKSTAVHAVIEFDAGPGTPLRRYIHINGALVNREGSARTADAWWWKSIDRLGPSGVLVKGSMAAFHDEHMGRDLAPTVLGWLRRSGGVLIEDRDHYDPKMRAGFSSLRPGEGRSSPLPDYEGARSAAVSVNGHFDFGYSKRDAYANGTVYVTAFDRPAR